MPELPVVSQNDNSQPKIDVELELKAVAFRKIYVGLRYAQQNNYATNFMHHKDDLDANDFVNAIKNEIKLSPNGRTKVAWDLANKHFRDVTPKNTDLFNEMYSYVYNNKRYGGVKLFYFSKAPTLTAEQIQNIKLGDLTETDKIGWAIKEVLSTHNSDLLPGWYDELRRLKSEHPEGISIYIH